MLVVITMRRNRLQYASVRWAFATLRFTATTVGHRMNKNRSIIILGWMLSLAVAIPAVGETGPPNILFIMSDDHTTQAIGAYGSRLAKLNPTPHIDSLAKGGMRFDRVFCNNSICTPSRASIITGQYSQTNGVLDLTGSIPPERQYLPMEMGKAGYHTAMIGKWHLKQEPAAFDYYCVLPGQGSTSTRRFEFEGTNRGRATRLARMVNTPVT